VREPPSQCAGAVRFVGMVCYVGLVCGTFLAGLSSRAPCHAR
jgi:hypothetical protein